jgi:uncharacterized protein YidB (DUF937 family)
MGLLEEIAGMVESSAGTPSGSSATATATPIHPGLVGEAMAILSGGSTASSGGLAGLMQKFAGAGLGHLMNSWVGNGPNQPATASHIEQVLGSDAIRQIAGKLGIPTSQASSGLAAILPAMINHVTPNGTAPDQSSLQSALASLKAQLGV